MTEAVRRRISAVHAIADPIRQSTDIRAYLRDRSAAVRMAAVDRIRVTRSMDLQEYVRPLLRDKNGMVRYSAVECLGDLYEGSGSRAYWLDASVDDSDDLVRIETLEAWLRIGDLEALQIVASKLEDENPLVRCYAALSISGLGGRQYLELLRKKAEMEDADSAMVGLASALFDLGDAEYLEVLFRLLHSEVYQVRCAAANSIGVAKLSNSERARALIAVQRAKQDFLFRADRSTMERVEQELLDAESDLVAEEA